MIMKINFKKNKIFPTLIFFLVFFFLNIRAFPVVAQEPSPLASLLPELKSWEFLEAPQRYLPNNLFEYIDGAAEVYLSYDFQELLVAHYSEKETKAALTLEIYDMGNENNSFGIYSAERSADCHFLPVGIQGYIEEGALNFIIGHYYIKLLCFDSGPNSDRFLKLFSQEVEKRVKEKGGFPRLLKFFPQEGLVPNSEKFVLRNFLGYKFLSHGYSASYRHKDHEFECFFIEAKTETEASHMLKKFLESFERNGRPIQKLSFGYCFKDPYLENVFLSNVGNLLCGVIRIKDDFYEVGHRLVEVMINSLKSTDVFN